MFSISPRKLFLSFGSLFPSHFDSLLPRLLPAQVLQSVIKKINENKQNVVKLPCFLWIQEKYFFPFLLSALHLFLPFLFWSHSCSYSLFLTLAFRSDSGCDFKSDPTCFFRDKNICNLSFNSSILTFISHHCWDGTMFSYVRWHLHLRFNLCYIILFA